MNLHEMTVLVTGAASGIGHALAKGFLNDGAAVVAADRNTEGLVPLENKGRWLPRRSNRRRRNNDEA